jgi:glyoxylase-like metal-dependent hydrolase (beta-lactamase superfamily II)/rhodanese-related sulfurtransferase
MDHVLVLPVLDQGLGNQAYLVDLGDGRALAVDPSLDLRVLDREAEQRGLRVAVAAETHLHADFVSGATRLARRDGARVVGSSAGGRRFEHVGVADGDTVDLGGLALRAWGTPGHTDEHVSYLLEDDGQPLAVFTGGSLIVGAAARTDLVSPELTEPLARAQFRSLRRLAALPDGTPVYPTHGAGSFCSAPPGAERTTTIGREKATNPLMAIADEDLFVATLLGSLGSYPPYFSRLSAVNRQGPVDPGPAALAALPVSQVVTLRATGAEVIDVRPVSDYGTGHVPGSIANTLRPAFATWLGWLVADPGTPLIVVRNPDQDPDEILWQARKIGYDHIVGELAGGMPAWIAAGQLVATTPLVQADQVDPAAVVDIRQASEYRAGHLPGAIPVELGALTDHALPNKPLVTMCGHGERAASAASMLERAGRHDISVLTAGPSDWATATGRTLDMDA